MENLELNKKKLGPIINVDGYIENGKEFEVSDVKTVGAFVVCSLSGVTTVEDAIKLKNKILELFYVNLLLY